MSVGLYDEALTNKIKNWLGNSQITLTSPDETKRMFEIIADKNNDKPIALPMICLRRTAGYNVLHTTKDPKSYDGFTTSLTFERSIQLNVIPISIDYQMDIYTRYFSEADEYARNIVFNLINYPKLTVEIPYRDQGLSHESNVFMASEVADNSSIPERLVPGQFTRLTLKLNVPDAYLFDVRIRDNISIEADTVEV